MNKKEFEKNVRWLNIKNAFRGTPTPDCYLIGHGLMGVSPKVGEKSFGAITVKGWRDFSNFCNMCDTIANMINSGIDRMSCLSLWMSYECEAQKQMV